MELAKGQIVFLDFEKTAGHSEVVFYLLEQICHNSEL
uniref:Uncharacterized protein n=1 Tax=Arundo donax TaxID=35708 RepID=A0A0A9CC38_ARUDO